VVQGGWQEARGGEIGPQYTLQSMNNSYFVENIKEELDVPGEFFVELDGAGTDGAAGGATLYLIPPTTTTTTTTTAATTDTAPLPSSLTLVGTLEARVVQYAGNSSTPVQNMQLVNVTIAHSAYTFMHAYETSSGGDWSIHRGAAVFLDGATNISISGCSFDQLDGECTVPLLGTITRRCQLGCHAVILPANAKFGSLAATPLGRRSQLIIS
jgi:hypothetical protein